MIKLKSINYLMLKSIARLVIPNSNLAEVVELEAKRKLGKLGGGESIALEVRTALQFLDKISNAGPIIVFDVGANVGNYSHELLNLRPDFRLVAFEPSSKAFNSLKNRFVNHPNVNLVNAGLGNKEESADLHFDKAGSGLASLTKRNLVHIDVGFNEFEVVSVLRGEDWVKKNNIAPTFVKIDVEGHELDVLLGFGELLNSISLIQFEFGGCNIDSRTYMKDFWILLSPLFDIYRITPNGHQIISQYTENEESFMTSNLIAVRKS